MILTGRLRAWRASRRVRRGALAALILGIFALPALLGAISLLKAKAAFEQAIVQAGSLNIAEARLAFSDGERFAATAEERLNTPIVRLAGKLPVIGNDVRTVRALATAAREMAPAALKALATADVFPRGPNNRPQLGLVGGKLDLTPWPGAALELKTAAAQMRTSIAKIDRMPSDGLLSPVRRARSTLVVQGKQAAKSLDTASDAISLVPHFFGADRPRTWFLFIQNPTELRGTGGFLGAYGILRADAGKLDLERFDSNFTLPAITAPPPAEAEFARHYDQFGSRTFWPNANFTPDFPTAAKLMANLWTQGTGQPIDGVIAIDASGLNSMLGLVGPIDVPPFGEMNSSTFLPFALNEAYIRFPERADRVRALLEVGLGVWSRVLVGNLSNLSNQVGTLAQMITNKRIQIWSPEKQEVIERLGLGGQLRPEPGADFLMVVGNNAGGNKLDYYSRRSISYRVGFKSNLTSTAQVDVRVANTAPLTGLPPYVLGLYPEFPSGLLRAVTSIFMPQGSLLQRATVNDEIVPDLKGHLEKNLQAVTAYVPVPSRSASTFSVSTSRQVTTPGTYRLLVQQQPSLHPDQFNLEIELPPGSSVSQVTQGMQVQGNRVSWKGFLTREREFLVRYETPKRSSL